MPIPLTQLRLDADFQDTGTPYRNAALKLAHKAAGAIGVQAVLIVLGSAAFLYRLLWKPLAFLTVACFVTTIVFMNQGDYLNAVSAGFFTVICLGIMAALKTVAGAVHSAQVQDT